MSSDTHIVCRVPFDFALYNNSIPSRALRKPRTPAGGRAREFFFFAYIINGVSPSYRATIYYCIRVKMLRAGRDTGRCWPRLMAVSPDARRFSKNRRWPARDNVERGAG